MSREERALGADPRLEGSRQIGAIWATFSELVTAFGSPADRDDTAERGDGKVRCIWIVEHEPSGVVLSIYDWKRNNAARWGQGEYPVERVTVWSVGGTCSADAALMIMGAAGFGLNVVPHERS